MIKLHIEADDELRTLVQQEVCGALIAMSNSEVSKGIQEGIRRAIGKDDANVEKLARSVINARIDGWYKAINTDIGREITAAIKVFVEHEIRDHVSKRVASELTKLDVKSAVEKAVAKRIESLRIG